jgi:phenylalanyl-tRNA synthetase beta chain
MRVPLRWLYEYCDPGLDAPALAERLAMTGTEIERIERHGVDALEHFVVGRVLERHRHPDADRLSVCMVDTGGSTPAQIVCGAPNVRAGQLVAVARPGAVMPDGSTLRRARLRGQTSEGMILAEDELGIGTDHDGIIVLDERDGLAPGAPLAQVLPITDQVLVAEITPNRPDCLGIYGIAREVHAATGAPLADAPWARDPGSQGPLSGIEIEVQCPELCPRFTARIFEGVRVAPSPEWLKARLMAAGQRPINNVVDITNYVMLLTGQPLHAFDLERIAGAHLVVRRAQAGETVRTLDGAQRELGGQMVVIADAQGPTSIAGVMGGERSEVTPATGAVLLEAACWDGPNIHRTSLELGLRSEASARFEKQLEPEQAMEAQAVASALMIELCGARPRPGTVDIGGPGPAPVQILLRDRRVSALLGVAVERARWRAVLEALGLGVKEAPEGLLVSVSAHRRGDLRREADLIEEVARLDALAKLSPTLPGARRAVGEGLPPGVGVLSDSQRRRRVAADALVAQGLREVVGWSFASPELSARLQLAGGEDERADALALANPMSGETSRLRTMLLGSLLDIAARNRARGVEAIALFESGPVYLRAGDRRLPHEPHHVGALVHGPLRRRGWRGAPEQPGDFFAAKALLGALLDALGVSWRVRAGAEPFLHPGRAGVVLATPGAPDGDAGARGGEDGRDAGRRRDEGLAAVGWIGELHPLVAARWGLEGAPVAVFEIDLDALGEPAPARYRDLTSFPEVREDLAVVVADDVSAEAVIEVVREAGRPLLAAVEVFDVYRDRERIGEGLVSLALALHYRAPDRTLTDEEVAVRRQAILAALAQRLGGRIRA